MVPQGRLKRAGMEAAAPEKQLAVDNYKRERLHWSCGPADRHIYFNVISVGFPKSTLAMNLCENKFMLNAY
jgi:hypothetical protein